MAPGLILIYRDKRLALRLTRWCLVFCSHRDYIVVTHNFTAVYLDLVPFRSFTVTRSSQPSTRTGKKQVTATLTAPNQTAGPLVVSCPSKNPFSFEFRKISKLHFLINSALVKIELIKNED